MFAKKATQETVQGDMAEGESHKPSLNVVSKIAPAVALLLLGDSGLAAADSNDLNTVPEPSMLALLGVGVGVAAAAKYMQSKRRK